MDPEHTTHSLTIKSTYLITISITNKTNNILTLHHK